MSRVCGCLNGKKSQKAWTKINFFLVWYSSNQPMGLRVRQDIDVINQFKQPRRAQAAFTLFEAMLAAALVLALVTVGAPSFRGLQVATSLDSQSAALRSTLRLGRDEAIRTQGDVVVCPSLSGLSCDSSDWNDGWLLFVDALPAAFTAEGGGAAGAGIGAEDTIIRYTSLLVSDVQLLASISLVRFDSRGRTQPAIFQLCANPESGSASGSAEQSVRLNLAGLISYVAEERLCET